MSSDPLPARPELAQRVEEFLVASIRDWTGRAARMLARDPQIATYDFRTAVILGDAARVRAMLGRDPSLATRADPRTGWTALHVVTPPVPPLSAAIALDCAPAIIALLLEHGADPNTPGPDGRTPYQLARRKSQAEIAALLAGHGADTALTPADRFLSACRQGNRAEAGQILAADPGLPARLTVEDHRVLVEAADHGHAEAVRLMLDLGFPPDVHAGPDADGATALHAAAAAGSVATVQLLLDRGADIEARDTSWDSTPMEWAIVGSGMHLGHDPDHDWVATVRTLIEAGAATDGIVLSPDDPKPPSPEVAGLLRSYGIPDQAGRPAG